MRLRKKGSIDFVTGVIIFIVMASVAAMFASCHSGDQRMNALTFDSMQADVRYKVTKLQPPVMVLQKNPDERLIFNTRAMQAIQGGVELVTRVKRGDYVVKRHIDRLTSRIEIVGR